MKALLVFAVVIAAVAAKYDGPTNQAGINLIKEFEGFMPNFYTDPVGIRTIGYGHACHVWDCSVPLNGRYNVPLSQADGESLLRDDLSAPGSYESCVASAVTYQDLNEHQYSALASFTFNLGCGNLRSSTLLEKLNAGDVQGAADEFPRWVYGGGKVLPGLVRRRAAEVGLFCTGGTCASSCTGTTTDGLNIRAAPSTDSAIVGSLAQGTTITIQGRETGTNINGNPWWFKISNGYVSAYYINMGANNGAAWCSKT